MKNLTKIFAVLTTSVLMLSSCIEETFPEGGSATAEQVGSSASAIEASVNGIPAQMAQGYLVFGDQVHETDMGYPAMMIAQTELLGDMYPLGSNSGYDWYREYNTCPAAGSMGPDSYTAYLSWFSFYMFVKSANSVIAAVDLEDPNVTDVMKSYVGRAYVDRAFQYYHLMLFWEPVENIYTNVKSVLGLTAPIVTEKTTGEEAKNNPRVKHDDMVAFILSDLDKAEELLQGTSSAGGLFPTLAVAYGVKARVYMWDKDYKNAAKYARLAIDTFGGAPTTQTQWLDLKSGFNTAVQSWMWYLHYSAENMGNLCNFTGWMSGEADWGYSSLTFPGIDRSLYDGIAESDFRKYTFLDPSKYDFYNYETVRTKSYIEDDAPAYLSLKFRCGNGDWENYAVGAAVDVPVMRVEEFYLMEAEAIGASEGVSKGVNKLNSFMTTYRQPDYDFNTSDLRELQLEVLKQMRIEFWGEGQAFAFAKRLKPGVMQNYAGTNAPDDIFKINCKDIKPNWNFCVPQDELDANVALQGKNNPNPTATVAYPSKEGVYSEAKK